MNNGEEEKILKENKKVFGCDICQDICPHNKNIPITSIERFKQEAIFKLDIEEINDILKQAGATLDNVVKAVIYLKDINDFKIVSPIRAEYFKNSMPVSTMVEVGGFVRNGSKIEIEVTAILEK